MIEKREAFNLFFPLAAGLGVLFCVTVLSVSAAMFGDPAAPVSPGREKQAGYPIQGRLVARLRRVRRRSAATLRQPSLCKDWIYPSNFKSQYPGDRAGQVLTTRRQDRSLSWIVQQAWRIARSEIMRFPSVDDVVGEEAET